jgi:hypothetical protein
MMKVYAGKGVWKWMPIIMVVAPFMNALVPNKNKGVFTLRKVDEKLL